MLRSLRECSKTRYSPHGKGLGVGGGSRSADIGRERFVAAYVLILDTCNCSVQQSGCLILPGANKERTCCC